MAEDRGGDDADKTNTAQEHHHDLYHYVFIIVGSIVTAGIEFALVWPENHHLALLFLVSELLQHLLAVIVPIGKEHPSAAGASPADPAEAIVRHLFPPVEQITPCAS